MLEHWFQEVMDSFEEAGYPTRPGCFLREWLAEAGFEDVKMHHYYVPIGVWPKERHYVSCDRESDLSRALG
jgi:hypothetical protein